MDNKAMQRKLKARQALDLSACPRIGPYYVLPETLDIEGMDLCDARLEAWMWSAGRAERDFSFEHEQLTHLVPKGVILVSMSADLYQRDGIECVFLR